MHHGSHQLTYLSVYAMQWITHCWYATKCLCCPKCKESNRFFSDRIFRRQFHDSRSTSWHFPDSHQIPGHYQVFQTSGHVTFAHNNQHNWHISEYLRERPFAVSFADKLFGENEQKPPCSIRTRHGDKINSSNTFSTYSMNLKTSSSNWNKI